MRNLKALLSSNSDEYSTPGWIFAELDDEFGFTLDPCATEENHKCERYFTKENNGLKQSWKHERVFCNPPYSEIGKWVKKSWEETRTKNTVVVLLIPARTDTKWFHDYILHRSEIRPIRGRLRFNGMNVNAPFPSMVVIFRGAEIRETSQEEMFAEEEDG